MAHALSTMAHALDLQPIWPMSIAKMAHALATIAHALAQWPMPSLQWPMP